MKVPTTYVDRRYSNEYVVARANTEIQWEAPSARGITIMSEYHRERRIMMLAKLIAKGDQEPSAAVTMDTQTLKPHDWG